MVTGRRTGGLKLLTFGYCTCSSRVYASFVKTWADAAKRSFPPCCSTVSVCYETKRLPLLFYLLRFMFSCSEIRTRMQNQISRTMGFVYSSWPIWSANVWWWSRAKRQSFFSLGNEDELINMPGRVKKSPCEYPQPAPAYTRSQQLAFLWPTCWFSRPFNMKLTFFLSFFLSFFSFSFLITYGKVYGVSNVGQNHSKSWSLLPLLCHSCASHASFDTAPLHPIPWRNDAKFLVHQLSSPTDVISRWFASNVTCDVDATWLVRLQQSKETLQCPVRRMDYG